MSTISGTGASDLLAKLQQQLLANYVNANSTNSAGPANSTNATDTTGQSATAQLFGTAGSDDSSDTGPSSDSTPTGGGGISFGPGMLASLLSFLEAQSTGSSSTATTSAGGTATTAVVNATDTTQSSDPIAQALFSAIDSDGDGEISQSELENAFTSNGSTANSADALYSQLAGSSNSTDGTANGIGLSQFTASLTPADIGGPPPGGPGGVGGGHHHHGHGGGGDILSALFGNSTDSSNSTDSTNATDSLLALFGESASSGTSSSTTNSDGSSTTTISYADGTTITIDQPASAASNSTDATSSTSSTGNTFAANFEQYIAKMLDIQSQLFDTSNLGSTLSVSA